MAITFIKEKNLFHLHNNEFSYYVQIHSNGMIVCPYFGQFIDEIDLEQINKMSDDWFSNYYSHITKTEQQYNNLWLNSSSMVLPSDKGADIRPSAISIDGFYNNKLDFRYVSHKIYKGKPILRDLPYIRDDERDSDTLEIILKDYTKNIFVVLSLTIFEKYNIIIRNTTLLNNTNSGLWLERAMSVSQDFSRMDMDIVHFPGEWCYERQFRRESLSEGTKVVSSSTGRSSHEHNPFVMLADKDATETNGEVYGFSFMYSGSFVCEANVGKTGVIRLTMGIDDNHFRYEVLSGDSFEFPEGVMIYSDKGFEKISHQLHNIIRSNIIKEGNKTVYRSVLLNSWEGYFMDFNTDKIISLIRSSKDLGVKLFVLDDGWFGKRDSDNSSLGDWFINEKKIDLQRVIDECHTNNMRFGLWIEPEMINFDSELMHEHPEYASVDINTDPWMSRHQVALNFADNEVVDYIYNMLDKIFSTYDIDYVKWDHNRSLEDCRAANLDWEHQDEFYHRNTLGYYRLARMLTEKYPNIHFQGCASGGGRFDLGTLFYFSDIWTSDENNPVQRLFIQYGTSFAYPPSVMGSHINDCTITKYRTKAEIALFGSYGFELDPRKLTPNEIAELNEVTDIYNKFHNEVVLDGDLYRLESPFSGKAFAVNMVSKDKKKALFLFVNLLKRLRARRFIKLRGLDPSRKYSNNFDGKTYSGDYYMKVGINLSTYLGEFDSYLITLEEK